MATEISSCVQVIDLRVLVARVVQHRLVDAHEARCAHREHVLHVERLEDVDHEVRRVAARLVRLHDRLGGVGAPRPVRSATDACCASSAAAAPVAAPVRKLRRSTWALAVSPCAGIRPSRYLDVNSRLRPYRGSRQMIVPVKGAGGYALRKCRCCSSSGRAQAGPRRNRGLAVHEAGRRALLLP